MATRPPTRGEVAEWKSSVPISHMPVSPPGYILRRLRELSPLLSLRWNPRLNQVSIWQAHPGDPDALPMLVQFPGGRYLPWGPIVDERVIICLAAGDRRKYALPTQADEVIENKEKKTKAAEEKAYAGTDPEALLWSAQRQIGEMNSVPLGVQSFVPQSMPEATP